MSTDILKPGAAVTIGLSGLAVCCHNQTFNNNRGRWEIAIPRFNDHVLRVEIDGVGTFTIARKVKFIEIKAKESISAAPTHEVEGDLDRKDLDKNINDFRWLTDFSHEPPHKTISPITKPDRVAVTMLYVYDATAYTKSTDSSMLIRPDLEKTGPIVNGKPEKVPEATLVPILDDTQDFFFEARMVGMDIESSGGDAVDMLIDKANKVTVPHGNKPQQILISNLEPPPRNPNEIAEILATRFIATDAFHYGLGDFYRYYELFDVEGQKIHQWGKQPVTDDDSGANGECCCNPTKGGGLANLDAFV